VCVFVNGEMHGHKKVIDLNENILRSPSVCVCVCVCACVRACVRACNVIN
jgi:hypothetical protein